VQVIRPADDTRIPDAVVITGGARGIGLEVARILSAAGSRVGLIDHDRDRLEHAVESLSASSDGVVVARNADVAEEAGLAAAVDAVAAEIGPLDGLVTSAAIDRGGLIHEVDTATWDEVMAVNLRGTFLACRAAISHLLESGGAIVCLSSPFAFVAAGRVGAYAAAKGGVSALVRALAVDYAEKGIRVNAVLPGPTETDLMWASVPDDEVPKAREAVRREVPLGRLAEPSEPARAVVWLLSGSASYVTGAQLSCDGGVLARASISV
jgi:NAD(P)-dependent dehydrogenase (short-subunit alcohol dehydrogenase family)